jgi:hypothetical protein
MTMTRKQQHLSLIVSGFAIPDLATGLVEKESLGGASVLWWRSR